MSTSRREFLTRVATGSAALVLTSSVSRAQQSRRGMVHDSSLVRDSTGNLFAMDQDAAIPVRLPPKPNAKPSMTDHERDELEHHIHCQCGCTLDIFTCRTTDFTCQVSPSMHRDVVALVEGGYSAQEILDAFVGTFGERVRMAPKKSNVFAWFTPGVTVIVGAGVIAMLLKRWRNEKPKVAPIALTGVDATPEELARLDAVLKGDDRP